MPILKKIEKFFDDVGNAIEKEVNSDSGKKLKAELNEVGESIGRAVEDVWDTTFGDMPREASIDSLVATGKLSPDKNVHYVFAGHTYKSSVKFQGNQFKLVDRETGHNYATLGQWQHSVHKRVGSGDRPKEGVTIAEQVKTGKLTEGQVLRHRIGEREFTATVAKESDEKWELRDQDGNRYASVELWQWTASLRARDWRCPQCRAENGGQHKECSGCHLHKPKKEKKQAPPYPGKARSPPPYPGPHEQSPTPGANSSSGPKAGVPVTRSPPPTSTSASPPLPPHPNKDTNKEQPSIPKLEEDQKAEDQGKPN